MSLESTVAHLPVAPGTPWMVFCPYFLQFQKSSACLPGAYPGCGSTDGCVSLPPPARALALALPPLPPPLPPSGLPTAPAPVLSL